MDNLVKETCPFPDTMKSIDCQLMKKKNPEISLE